MGIRGPKSNAALAVVPSSVVDVVHRPGPPAELTAEQSQEWLAVVNRLPAEWFQRETFGMLAQYCRHVVSARKIAQLLEKVEKSEEAFDVAEYDRLLKMQEREGRAMSSLGTRMRITQQSTYDPRKKKGGPKVGWKFDHE